MSRIFITGSGTEVGKTFVTCALIKQLETVGHRVNALKPVVTGFDPSKRSDSGRLLGALGLKPDEERVASISPWRFKEPLSPDIAAAREDRSIPFDELITFCTAERDTDITLIEGIGGVMVPLDTEHSVLDWIDAVHAPALLVVGSYLGSLSHTLTAAGVLQARGVELAGIVVSESQEQPVTAQETAEVIGRFTGGVPIKTVPRVADPGNAPDLVTLLAPYLR
jgi:dethiobiotin synthetase